MKTLYFECNMGAAGDMLMSALYDICDQKETFIATMNQLFSPDIKVTPMHVTKNGIMGTQIQVLIHETEEGVYQYPATTKHSHATDSSSSHTHSSEDHVHHHDEHTHHQHVSYTDILDKIATLALPDTVKENAAAIYSLIGDAEAKVHGTTLDQIHFHEVGTLDALVDVVGCSYLIYLIAPDEIYCSPIHVGSGFVQCAHGVLPVPAPATAEILNGVPYYSGSISSELCTPTGAAVLKHYAKDFTAMPSIQVASTGYGMGHKDFPIINCVRAFLGTRYEEKKVADSSQAESVSVATDSFDDQVLEISCNLDDMTGEAIGFATDFLMSEGALDVYTIPIQMKKNRPGNLLVCYCEPSQKEKFTKLIFANTTTRGMRYQYYGRAKLESETVPVTTPYGKIRIKKSIGYDTVHVKPEFDDVKEAARKNHVSLATVYDTISLESITN